MHAPHDFHLGIVLSGGATRGSYTAGVLDYLLEVLSEWEKARLRKDKQVPQWSVNVRNMVSSSAGALAAALSAASITAYHEPMPRTFKLGDDPPTNNLLYRAWVSEFSIDKIFDCSDLPAKNASDTSGSEIKSLLNSSFMLRIANDLCRHQKIDQPVPSWAHDLQLYFTCMNMRGVPYSFEMDGSLDQSARKYAMLGHSDSLGFSVRSKRPKHMFRLDLHENRSSPAWQRLFKTATASASIPCIFPPVVLSRPLRHYDETTGNIATKPKWPKHMPKTYRFNASDGGMLDNEPVGLSRSALQQSAQRDGMEKSAERSWGAILLIDTGSNGEEAVKAQEDVTTLNLWQSIQTTFIAVRSEASLKREELSKAGDENDFSQYIISPLREGRKNKEPALATATLQQFGGILGTTMRHHDFMLGRRNCQLFLKNHFRIRVNEAKANPIFRGVEHFANPHDTWLPIIPLLGKAALECPEPEWPRLSEEEKLDVVNIVEKNVTNRVERILSTMAKNSGILKPPSPWWKLWARMWQKALRAIIGMLARYCFKRLEGMIWDALNNF